MSVQWMNASHQALFTHRSLSQLDARRGFDYVTHTYRGWRRAIDEVWHVARHTGEATDPTRNYEDPDEVVDYVNRTNRLRSALFWPLYSRHDRRTAAVSRLEKGIRFARTDPGRLLREVVVRAAGRRADPMSVRRRVFSAVRTGPDFAGGVLRYVRTGQTGESGYQAMVRLYCVTRGVSNDVLHQVVRRRRPRAGLAGDGVLGLADDALVDRLTADGYVVFPNLLPADLCDRLTALARRAPGEYRPPLSDGERRGTYDPSRSGLQTCWIDEAALASDSDVQSLVSDPSVLGLAEAYLGCLPVLSILAMWWTRPGSSEPAELAEKAQMFHFDLDRLKWLKLFAYLTEVTPENGPHVFVRGSHRRGAKPGHLLRRGYQRITDEELAESVDPRDVVEITGPRGTLFVADTSGFHKGKAPVSGERLVLQLEFADALFGGRFGRVPDVVAVDPRFGVLASSHPEVLPRWTVRYSGPRS